MWNPGGQREKSGRTPILVPILPDRAGQLRQDRFLSSRLINII